MSMQALHSFLCDCRLVDPGVDQWRSFKAAMRTFVDCWFGGAKPIFIRKKTEYNETHTEFVLEVWIESPGMPTDECVFVIEYDPNCATSYQFMVEDCVTKDSDLCSYQLHKEES